jgi:hypothetical protein
MRNWGCVSGKEARKRSHISLEDIMKKEVVILSNVSVIIMTGSVLCARVLSPPTARGWWLSAEQKVQIDGLTNGACLHPLYQYTLEAGGFCSWRTTDIRHESAQQ